ncbi:N-acetylgalactosamine-6-sulfatase [Adhaeribacter aerolatus]|uniref:N-acetylgalactosamine-6-sulfatase n=1 Tax=Adhaeribacter aerolatus TaxID=670289 RepID=A0A512B6P5_9BACT|nr:sulfatase-like hydrolase/transferase [Adhaeribacter aerolatus]GEO07457.1 N-acetylgalactosamine-6-sulfatase [Adhaeribacter aerolatus]
MSKYSVALILFFVSLTSGFNARAQGGKPAAKKQPNIIFILTDDLGWGDLGTFFQKQRQKNNDRSEPWAFTPNLDKMAAGGAKLPHHYCAAPVCAPSRASILMGVSQGHANVRDNQFDKALEDNHTIASVLRRVGYATAAIGKWGLQGGSKESREWPAHPNKRGFDYYYGYMRHADGHEHYPKEGIYRGAKEVWENNTEVSAGLDKCYTGDLWTAAAKRWIVEHKKGQQANNPFFMYLAYDTPHAVLELPTQPYPAGGGLKGGMQWVGKPGQMINTASGSVDSWVHPDYAKATYDHDNNKSTPEVAWPDVYKRYATSVRRIDDQVGDLITLLKDLKEDTNTLIVFTSDNGPSLESYLPDTYQPNNPTFFNSFGPFDGVKRDVWEGGVRMPALAYWPGRIPANRVVQTPNASHDWLPTFTDAAGVPAPARIDGVSLLPSLTGVGKQREGVVYIEYFNNGITPDFSEFQPQHRKRRRNQMQLIRLGDNVGVRYDIKSQADDFEIYNVVKDLQQANNLAKNAGMAALQQQMKDKILQVRRPDAEAKRPYDAELVPGIAEQKIKAGLSWKAFTGNYPWLPEVATLKPVTKGQARQVDVKAAKAPDNSVLFFEGYLRVPTDGAYTFYVDAAAGSLLRIHEATVIDADYSFTKGQEAAGKILLKAGLHPFRFYTKKAAGKVLFNFQWEGPGISKQAIPATVFYQDAAVAAR